MDLSRREMIKAAPGVLGVAGLLGLDAAAADGETGTAGPDDSWDLRTEIPASFPQQDVDAVEEIVRVSHFDIKRVTELVRVRPALAKASWDWGFGDWETAIGAASHTGRREIAEVLMEHGARPTVFTFAMLGSVDAVRGMIEAHPGLQRLHGPHGITLMAHARAGGDQAARVVEYLEALGGADLAPKEVDIPAAELREILGTYAFGSSESERLDVFERRGKLEIRRGDLAGRRLLRVGPYEYHPTGAPHVRIRFDTSASPAHAMTIVDAKLTVVAKRTANQP